MLTEHLSLIEKDMIDAYREKYVYSGNKKDDFAPEGVEYILREWDNQKKDLFKLLDNQLIFTKSLSYERSYDELFDEIEELRYPEYSFGRAARSAAEFLHAYDTYIWNSYYENSRYGDENRDLFYLLKSLASTETLVVNKYQGSSFSIEGKDGKKIKIEKGCKAIRALSKLAEVFDLPGFEDFRICHSQILNQKKLTGNLSLSIHPLDFMTMSDNDCDWESCMSWANYGSYRQGTVEMMNSPVVLVAYLSSENMKMPGQENYSWNSKKWRQLFIVDKNILFSVKSYPYENSDLTTITLSLIKDLAKKNLGWKYQEDLITWKKGTSDIFAETLFKKNGEEAKKESIYFEFVTSRMYSDIGTTNHYGYIAKIIEDDASEHSYAYGREIEIPYSGKSECLICGALDEGRFYLDLADESALACGECQEYYRCDCCEEVVEDNEEYIVDGEHLCPYCYENETFMCPLTNERHMFINSRKIFITTVPSKKVLNLRALTQDQMILMRDWSSCFEIYSGCNSEEIYKEFIKENGKLYDYYGDYFIFYDDLNDNGRDYFGERCYSNIEDFYNNFNDYSYCHNLINIINKNEFVSVNRVE